MYYRDLSEIIQIQTGLDRETVFLHNIGTTNSWAFKDTKPKVKFIGDLSEGHNMAGS